MNVGDPLSADRPLGPGMIFTVDSWYYDHGREITVFTEGVVPVIANG